MKKSESPSMRVKSKAKSASAKPRKRAAKLSPQSDAATRDAIDAFRAQHLDLTTRNLMTDDGPSQVLIDNSESPLAWLASRKGRDDVHSSARTSLSPENGCAPILRADIFHRA